ncbi:MAG: hypothetical protein ACOZQL_36650 [Myxococcota bacterium]
MKRAMLISLSLFAACDFESEYRRKYCPQHPDDADCAGFDAGTGGGATGGGGGATGGGGGDTGGGNATGGGGGAMDGGASDGGTDAGTCSLGPGLALEVASGDAADCLEVTLRFGCTNGMPRQLTTDTTFELSTADGGGQFFASASCIAPQRTINATSGSTQLTAWFAASQPNGERYLGTYVLSARATTGPPLGDTSTTVPLGGQLAFEGYELNGFSSDGGAYPASVDAMCSPLPLVKLMGRNGNPVRTPHNLTLLPMLPAWNTCSNDPGGIGEGTSLQGSNAFQLDPPPMASLGTTEFARVDVQPAVLVVSPGRLSLRACRSSGPAASPAQCCHSAAPSDGGMTYCTN